MQEIRIEWGLWNEICDFVPKSQFISGIFLDEYDKEIEDCTNKLGLKMYINGHIRIGKENDYLVKRNNKCFIINEKQILLRNKLRKCKMI